MTSTIPEQVKSAMPIGGDGLSHKQIRDLVGEWAPTTIKASVRALVLAGDLVRLGTEQHPLFRRVA